jgi:M-phase inducer phosphatase 2
MIDNFIIIDCRYPYEYVAGHIDGAVNMVKKDIKRFYIANKSITKKVAVIFHCEYSKNRGPRACAYFRKLDRDANSYPNLVSYWCFQVVATCHTLIIITY